MNKRTLSLAFVPLFAACGGSSTGVSKDEADPVIKNYSAMLYEMYSDALNDETTFATNIQAFLAAPSEAGLDSARTAWLASREHYMRSESGRFYNGPIDADNGNPEAEINSWPLEESYIDYATMADGTIDDTIGLVNNPSLMPSITVSALDAANAQGADTNISDGYHAIEFLLWGQALQAVGPGTRPYTDYVMTGPRPNADRRGEYLTAATQGVVQHLTEIRDAWAPGAPYRTKFESGSVDGTDSLGLILTGLGRFSKGELANQRIDAPYESKERRDQHDCFSSETLVDYTRDAQGIVAMYTGTYGSESGPGISTIIAKHDATTAATLLTTVNASVTDMQAIPAPFEASIVGDDSSVGRMSILTTINSLRAQGDLFAQAAAAIGLKILVPDDNDAS